MAQSSGSKVALLRDKEMCMWHLHKLHQQVNIFQYQPRKHHPALSGTHHVFGRARVDEPETIITLCADCHGEAEAHKISKLDMVALLSTIVGIDLFKKYRSMCKWNEDDWLKVYP